MKQIIIIIFFFSFLTPQLFSTTILEEQADNVSKIIPEVLLPKYGSYIARLSKEDHYKSNGEKLTNALAIIVQDRANNHRFNKGDTEDEKYSYFSTVEKRSKIATMIRKGGGLSKKMSKAIIEGTPLIKVEQRWDSLKIALMEDYVDAIKKFKQEIFYDTTEPNDNDYMMITKSLIK